MTRLAVKQTPPPDIFFCSDISWMFAAVRGSERLVEDLLSLAGTQPVRSSPSSAPGLRRAWGRGGGTFKTFHRPFTPSAPPSFTPATRAFCHHSPHLYSKTRKHTPTPWTSVRQESHDQIPQLPRLPGHLMSVFSFSSLCSFTDAHFRKKSLSPPSPPTRPQTPPPPKDNQ